MRVTTETGSVYEITDTQVRRIEHTHRLRRDGEWLKLDHPPLIQIGRHMVLYLEPLGEGNVTIRTTSRVTGITP